MEKTRTLNELRQVKTYGYKAPRLKKMAKKSKYNRRRAIECKLIERSKNNPGYCKYMITIAEMDGTVHKQPAYGKDMQGALSRLLNKERTVKAERRLMDNPFVFFLGWLLIMGWPAIIGKDISSSPWYVVYGFIGIISLILIGTVWNNYITKGE